MKRQKQVTHVSALFEKYQQILVPPQASVERVFVQVVKEQCSIELCQDQIEYHVRSATIFLKLPGVLKQELLLHKTVLVEAVKQKIGPRMTDLELR